MKKRKILIGLIAALALMSLPPACPAQDKAAKAPDPHAFSIRVYRLPADELGAGFVSKEEGRLHAPPLPPASASAGELESFLKHSHAVVKEYLAPQGIILPKGSLACYDPASETLALRTTANTHGLVGPFAEASLIRVPHLLNWSVEIVEAPAAAVRSAMKEALGKSDHGAVLDHLLPLGREVVTMRGETKSGVKVRAHQGGQIETPTTYRADSQQRVEADLKQTELGTSVELDPTIGADAHTIDITLSLTHHPAGPLPRWEALATAADKRIEARWLDHPLARVDTSLTFEDGTARLIGAWALEGAPEPERAGHMQAAFLRVNIATIQPLEDRRVEQILKAHGEAVEPMPKAVPPVPDPALPPGMIVRHFHVPRDLLTAGPAADSAADPFTKAAPRNEPRFTRQVTVEEILKSAGIPFPEGASANLIPGTSDLVVRNTPANIELVENFVSPSGERPPTVLSFTLHVVQADAALIRRLDRETRPLPDHAAAWKALEDAVAQGKAKIVRSLWLETKSGVEARAESVIEYTKGHGAELMEPKAGSAERLLEADSDIVPVGLSLRVNPTLGPDLRTLDLDFVFDYDFAPPVQNLVKEPLPEHTQRLAIPTTEFHRTSAQANTTMLSGATRLLSIWKPAGLPEFDADILQAVFLRAEVVRVETAEKTAQ